MEDITKVNENPDSVDREDDNQKCVIDNTIIKEKMREHSYWLQLKSEEEFMKHYTKGHNILLNSAQYINQDLMMGCAECQTCGMSWNTYSLDNSNGKVKLPHNEPARLVCSSKTGSIFPEKSILDSISYVKNIIEKPAKKVEPNHSDRRNEQVIKVKII